MNRDTASSCQGCDHDTHTHTHPARTPWLNPWIIFSNPAIQCPCLYSVMPLFSPPFSLFFFHHLLWTDSLLSLDQSLSLIAPYPLTFSPFWNHPSFLSISLNLQRCILFFLPCLTSFYHLTYIFSSADSLCTSLLLFFLSHCLYSSSLFRQPISCDRCKSPCNPHRVPPDLSLSLSLHIHCTMSLLATAMTMYYYLASKVTSFPSSSFYLLLFLSSLRHSSLPLLCCFSICPHLIFLSPSPTSPPPPLYHYSSSPPVHRFLPLWGRASPLQLFLLHWRGRNGQEKPLKYTCTTPTQLHASLICWCAANHCIMYV